MFREKLKKDLDGISPSDELLSRVSLMMSEEASKPKRPIYLNVAKWGGMAAAICLIAVGAVTFLGRGSDGNEIATADASGYSMDMAYSADTTEISENDSNNNKDSNAELSAAESTFKYFNFDLDASTIQLNENPDLSKKTIPEGYALVEYNEPKTISDLVDANTDIVIVKITDSSKYTGNSFALEADLFSAQTEAVVESEMFLAGDIIPVIVPRSSMEAELEIGKYYLLVTEEFESGIFKIYTGRESVFEIMDDITVVSQSHLKVPSMLDGLTVEEAAALLKYEQNLKK